MEILQNDKPLVFFVDDETELLELYEAALEDDFAVQTFSDPNDFLERVQKFKLPEPAVIVSDLNMPKLNGLDLLTKLRETTPLLCPFILFSGYLSKEHLIHAVDIGVEKVLEKPSSLDSVKAGVFEVYYKGEIKRIRSQVRMEARQISELAHTLERIAGDSMPTLKELLDFGYVSNAPGEPGITFREELQRLITSLNLSIEREQAIDRLSRLGR